MYAIINRFGWVLQSALSPLSLPDKQCVKVTDEHIKEAIRSKVPVRYTDGVFSIVGVQRSNTWDNIRKEREPLFKEADTALFKLSDRETLESVDLSAEKTQWATYREELRKVTEQSDPDNVTWPTKPSAV